MKYVNRPLITSKTDNFGIEGDQLELNCTVEADWDAKLELKWELPNNNEAERVNYALYHTMPSSIHHTQ